ncbi:MAG: acyltransferase [Lamprobacter sp.]|uniref:acyltransferase n=1 Tax=Lamprobacter sp. TaxID=3100796 RepID=UPI002B256B72|nr:acyltransferase [Lamprobacter sp.]MEA3642476.1 acyltransferase [Lamprobacter sp.]
MAKLDADISQRINILRYIMIFGIIILHTPPYVPLAETGASVFDFIKATFQHAIFRTSVPVLTFISGLLLFSASLDQKFKDLALKKTKTILVPLVIFNLPLALAVYGIQSNHLTNYEFSQSLYPFHALTWADAIFGLFSSPINYPLNFLRDLYVISLLSPLFGILIRKIPWTGFLVIFIIFWFDFDGDLVLRNTMPIIFYAGGMAALLNWDLRKLDRFAIWLLAAFLIFCFAIVFFQIENRNYLRVISPLLIWPASSLLVNSKFGAWVAGLAKYSFLTFLTHGPLLVVLWIFYQKVLSPISPYWLFWATTPLFISLAVILIYKFGYRLFPRIMKFIIGGR